MSERKISRGCDEALTVELVTADGAAYAVPSGGVVLLGLRPVMCGETVLVKQGTVTGDGLVRFDFVPEDTMDLIPGDYWFDVKLESGDKLLPLIRRMDLQILDSGVFKGGREA